MKPYFENVPRFGRALKPGRIKRAAASMAQLKQVEADLAQRRKDTAPGNTWKPSPPANPVFFRVAEPAQPAFASEDLYYLLPGNQKEVYARRRLTELWKINMPRRKINTNSGKPPKPTPSPPPPRPPSPVPPWNNKK